MVDITDLSVPSFVPNWIAGIELPSRSGHSFEKLDPTNGRPICKVARSNLEDVQHAVTVAQEVQLNWAAETVARRGEILRATAVLMQQRQAELAELVARETGKSRKDAFGETGAAIEMGFFIAGEGRRFYGKTTTSGVRGRSAMVIRQPLGIAGLIIAANTPIANVAWKSFPALLCGNSVILKASEDTPLSAWAFSRLLDEAGAPPGVFQIVHGYGPEAGGPIVEHPDVAVVSFTGSCEVGRWIAETAGRRLAKVCLELGGKNPLIVCDDANLELAVEASIGSAFSNAGQRCASGSRLIVFDKIYDRFKAMLVQATKKLTVGPDDINDLGPVINLEQLNTMIAAVERACESGASLLTGGERLTDPEHRDGYYMAPTIIENASSAAEISRTELFGPITCLYRAKSFNEALEMANDSPFGLTASIHTTNVNRAMTFIGGAKSGVAVVNGATYGSEPHMPFGGLKQSGNGTREAGTEAIDVYSDLKTVYIHHNETQI